MAELLETDVLIIGGGAAGANAALTAQTAGAEVLLVVKGFLGKSGASIFAGNLGVPLSKTAAVTKPADENRWLEVRAKYYFYLFDEEHTRASNKYVLEEWLPWMEQSGLYFRRLENGRIMTAKLMPETWAPRQGSSGQNVMDLLRKEVFAKEIKTIEETMATSLLTNNGVVVGATFVDYSKGKFFVVKAKATVIATGHANYMAIRSTGTREQCANGLAMAYKAGAELRSLEIQLWHVSDLAYPKSWMRLHVYPNPMPDTEETTRLYDSKGELIYELKSMNPDNVAPYHLQMRHLIQHVKAGNARLDGGYFSSYAHMDEKYLDRLEDYTDRIPFYKRVTKNWKRNKIECGVTWHMTYGGIKTDFPTMETNVPNLFAAGGATGHSTVHVACYDGKMSGLSAAARAQSTAMPAIDQDQVRKEEERVMGLLKTGQGIPAVKIKNTIRQVMFDKMGPIKNESQMQQALAELTRIRSEVVPQMVVESDTIGWNYELVDALDVFDMLDICEVTIKASLMRKESRGPFYREEYPYVDNKNYLKFIVVKLVNGKPQIYMEPVKNKTAVPHEDRVDYFKADY
jgi:succinate dehydrogenase flavoprotein subunit